jgi:hypothetical protein
VGVLATTFPDGIDQATIFPMGKYNPGYVLPRVAVDDDNVGTGPRPRGAGDAEHNAGIQVLNTSNFPNLQGPLLNVQ